MDHSKLRAPLEAEEVENNWAISYGDMITLLLGFFVLFFNIKTETVNITLIKKDLDKYFDSAKMGESRSVAQIDGIKKQKNSPVITTDISNKLQIKSNIEGERILVEFPGISFFESASHNLTVEGKMALSDFAMAIDQHLGLFRLVVRGYTDSIPLNARSRYKDNLELSAFRSISAIRYLAGEGVNLENMRIAGYGESSINRKEKDTKTLNSQRKVVIVIEPLDHTERVTSKPTSSSGLQPDAIGVEEALNAHVPLREVSSQKSKTPLQALMESVKEKIPSHEELKLMVKQQLPTQQEVKRTIRQKAQSVDIKITENKLYQKIINYFVIKNLKSKGYSEKEVSRLIKSTDKKGGSNK